MLALLSLTSLSLSLSHAHTQVSVDVNAPFAGKVTSVLTKLDEVVQVGAPLFVLDKGAAAPAGAVETKAAAPAPAAAAAAPVAAAPAKAETPKSAAPTAPVAPLFPTSAAASSGRFSRNETRVQMSALKQRAAQRQKDTQNTAAMLSTFQECDLGSLIAFRDELGESFEKTHGVKLGFMSAFLKASAQALQKVPAVNSCTSSRSFPWPTLSALWLLFCTCVCVCVGPRAMA